MGTITSWAEALLPAHWRGKPVVVETRGERVVLQGAMACLVAFLATRPEVATQVAIIAQGGIHITWGAGGPFKVSFENHLPQAKSSSLIGESS